MGKGSRNRQIHLQDKVDHPEKYKQKKQMPKWVTPLISFLVVAAILVGVVANFISDSGIIKRNRVLLESQTGKFDVNQNMATFLAWQEIYYSAYTYWYYTSYGIYEDTQGITKTFSSADQYALTVAQVSLKETLRDSIDDIMKTLKIYLAVCDEADRNGVSLDKTEKEDIKSAIDELKTMQTSYGYVSFKAFLNDAMGKGMKESDIKDALTLVNLYNKYTNKMQGTYEKAVTLEDLKAFRDENPADYFKIDYLTFAADNEDLAKKLKECKTAEEFKALVLENHLSENYKAAYNKYTTTVTASDALKTLTVKTGEALITALNDMKFDAAKEFTKNDDYTGKTQLKSWLLDSKRKQYETTSIVTEDGIYLVAFLSETASTEKVSARVKYYAFVEGEEFEGDKDFKKNILEYITQSKETSPKYPTVTYKKASEQADAFKKLLEADGADITKLLKDNNATEKADVKSGTSSTSTLPSAVIKAATASTVQKGSILVTNESNVYYVIYVSDVTNKAYDISFVSFNGDIYYQIINDLTTSLDKVYPTKQTTSFAKEPEKDSFEAWISALTDTKAPASESNSARKEGDVEYFKVTKDKVTTYNTYMVLDKPLYLDTENVVKGGYLEFTKTTYADDAKAALETLKDKTDLDLLNALSALDSSAKVSTTIKLSDASAADEKLSEWLFNKDRKANDMSVITAKDGKSAFVAVFIEKQEAWASAAKTNYVTEQLQEWVDGLAEKYTPNEKALNKLGEPTTTVETTTGTGESSETTDPHEGHDHD